MNTVTHETFVAPKIMTNKLFGGMIGFSVLIFSAVRLSFSNYLLFHTGIELFSIVIAFSILIIALNTYHISQNNFFIFFGIAYGFVGGLDLLHTLTYNGMGVFPGNTGNLGTQFWIIARYVESCSLLVSILFLTRTVKPRYIFYAYSALVGILLLSVLEWGIFPDCFLPGTGLTLFKKSSEYIISGLLVAAIILLKKHQEHFDPVVLRLILFAYWTTVAAEISFTLYVDVFGLMNMLGHIFKLISFYFIYKAVVQTSLRRPYKDLRLTAQKLAEEIEKREKLEENRRKIESEFYKISKLDSIGILAGGIAHDFNNILTIILGNSSLAKMYLKSDSKACNKMDEIEKACRQAIDLTQQLLTFSKGGEPVKRMVAINKLIKDTVNLSLSGSNVQCEFSISGTLSTLEIDEGQIKQAVNNLVINACQAMPQGGVIRVQTQVVAVTQKEAGMLPLNAGQYVKISIADQGVGIPQEIIDKIFDPFFTTKAAGHGLGLATAYSIIKKHHGYITVDSNLGVETIFHIYLPISPVSIEQKHEKYKKNGMGKGRILVMDDERLIQKTTGEMLALLGYTAALASCGTETIELFREAKEAGQGFDAVILDLTIPGGLGGKETNQRLLEIDPEVKSIVSSGYSSDLGIANFHHYGFKGCLKKPYTTEELSFVLCQVINESGGIAKQTGPDPAVLKNKEAI